MVILSKAFEWVTSVFFSFVFSARRSVICFLFDIPCVSVVLALFSVCSSFVLFVVLRSYSVIDEKGYRSIYELGGGRIEGEWKGSFER